MTNDDLKLVAVPIGGSLIADIAMSKKRILIVAGEASADRYGARLVRKLLALHGAGSLEFFGTGGDEMQKEGVRLLCHVRDLAI
jgi:lipid A disaccharide synthetase